MNMTQDVETYFSVGCGRCQLGGTPDCKVHRWEKELRELRRISLIAGLEESSKWGVPCYLLNGRNVFLINAFKDYCAVGFFKGILLKDEKKLLIKQEPHSHEDRIIKFTDVRSILEVEQDLLALMNQAAAIEAAGIPIPPRSIKFPKFPDELRQIFQEDISHKSAFETLTPGRQKSYLIHFSNAKQSKTRTARIEKCREKVFSGKGFNEY